MTKTYFLVSFVNYDYCVHRGLFSTKEKAEEFVKEQPPHLDPFGSYEIEGIELDAT